MQTVAQIVFPMGFYEGANVISTYCGLIKRAGGWSFLVRGERRPGRDRSYGVARVLNETAGRAAPRAAVRRLPASIPRTALPTPHALSCCTDSSRILPTARLPPIVRR